MQESVKKIKEQDNYQLSKPNTQNSHSNVQYLVKEDIPEKKQDEFKSQIKQLTNENIDRNIKNDCLQTNHTQIADHCSKSSHQIVNQILQKIEDVLGKDVKKESYQEVFELIRKYIVPLIHPKPQNEIGEILLENGSFIVKYIEMLAKDEETPFLRQYLVQYFQSKKISTNKQVFEQFAKKILQLKQSIPQKLNNNSRRKYTSQKSIQKRSNKSIDTYQKSIKRFFNQDTQPINLNKSFRRSLYTPNNKNYKYQEGEPKLGSFYIYELKQSKKTQRMELIQKRTSARFNSNNKSTNFMEANSMSKNSKNRTQSNRKSQENLKKQNLDDNDDGQQLVNFLQVSWIKEHFKQIDVSAIKLDQSYSALTQQDQQLTKYLKSIQPQIEEQIKPNKKKRNSQKLEFSDIINNQNFDHQKNKQDQLLNQTNQNITRQQSNKEIESEYLPLSIQQVVDYNLNNHGIFALLKLGQITANEMNTKYAITNLRIVGLANKRHIVQDLKKAAELANVNDHCQIGYISLNSEIKRLLETHHSNSTLITQNKQKQIKKQTNDSI